MIDAAAILDFLDRWALAIVTVATIINSISIIYIAKAIRNPTP